MLWQYEETRIFTMEDNEVIAEVLYTNNKDEINIYRVYVNPIARGRGLAAEAMKVAMKYFEEKSLKVTATCSYARSWLEKNR